MKSRDERGKESSLRDPLAWDANIEADILKGILSASTDACWCMEFGEPIDLTASDQEVVRQIFENDPFWRLCNAAMARLYLLPGDQDFNERPVREIFPRNRQNEAFIYNLIATGFELDAGPALDTRYDGVQIYVENDVRAHIADGSLIRMFGTVRDVSKHRRREMVLQDRLDEAFDLLSALPDPMIAVDRYGLIEAVNPAASVFLKQPADSLLGQPLGLIIGNRSDATAAVAMHLDETFARVATLGAPASLEVYEEGGRRSCWRIGPRERAAGTSFVISVATITEQEG